MTAGERHNDYDAFARAYTQDHPFMDHPLAGGPDYSSPNRGLSPPPSLFPALYADLCTNPRFLFFRLIAPESG